MSEGRTKKTARNAAFAAANHGITVILSFVNRTVFIRLLGVDYLGINGLFADILMMLSLADLGLTSAMAYSYYKPIAEHDTEKVAALLQYYKKIYQYIAASVAVLGLALVPFLDKLVRISRPIPHLRLYYLLMLANTVVSYLFVFKATLITADQKNYILSRYSALFSIARTLTQIVVIVLFRNYIVYLVTNVLFTMGHNLFVSKKADEMYPYILKKVPDLSRDDRSSIFQNIRSLFIYKLATVIMNGTDNTLISVLVGTVWVALYSNYTMVTSTLSTFINMLYTSSTASIGNIVAGENVERRQDAFTMIQTMSLLITTFTVICLSLLFQDLITVWMGDKYLLDSMALLAIILNFYLIGILHPVWSMREATGLFNQAKYIMPLCAIVNLVSSVIFGKQFGVAGILFASAFSRLTTYFWYEPVILFRVYLKQPARKFYLPLLQNVIGITAVVIICTYLFRNFEITTWPALLLKSFAVGIIALAVTILFYRRTSGYQMLKERLLGLLPKRH